MPHRLRRSEQPPYHYSQHWSAYAEPDPGDRSLASLETPIYQRGQDTQLETILLRPQLVVRDSSRRTQPGLGIAEPESERLLVPALPEGDIDLSDLRRQAG